MFATVVRRLAALSVLSGGVSLALFGAAVWGFRNAGWLWPQAYDLAGWGVLSAVAGVVLGLAGLLAWLLKGFNGAGIALGGLALSLPVAAVGVFFELAAYSTPPINDISTDTQDPPVFWFTATPSDYPAQNADPQSAAYPDVLPLEVPLSPDDAFMAALSLVEDRGWEVLSADPAESQIEAIARSQVFGFEDEVAIRITDSEAGSRIDVRSRSRLGQIDRGANARRIVAFLSDLRSRTED